MIDPSIPPYLLRDGTSLNRRRAVVASFAAVILTSLVALGSTTPWFSGNSPSPFLRASYVYQNELRFLQEVPVGELECTSECCQAFVEECPSQNPLEFLPLGVQLFLIVFLLAMSAVFSGLTLGLMGLDKTGLEIVMDGDNPTEAEYARAIFPLREDGNLLLCTLLLGNVAVNALLSILLADKAGGIAGFLASTFLIVIFGEIVPQALCSRYALWIGSRAVPLVRVLVVLFYPIAKPLAWALDRALGAELATTYSSAEMLKLLQIHVHEKVLDQDTAVAMTGALTFKDLAVKQVMTPLDNTFMLSVDERLSFETIAKIFKTGYSRIPVYEIKKDNVIGLLFTKDLIFIDPEDETRVADFVDIFGRSVHVVWPEDKLGDVLRELKKGKSHMALVRDVNNQTETDPYYELKGIITLEDIIEEILGDEIVDETDAFVDGSHMVKVDRAETFKWARLRLLDSKIVDERLSPEETLAVSAHLAKNYPTAVEGLTDLQLQNLIQETPVSLLPTANQQVGESLPDELLYTAGTPSDTCTLILAGKVAVLAGEESFRSDCTSWTLLAGNALQKADYTPDFSAFVSSGPCRCLRLTRAAFLAGMGNHRDRPVPPPAGGGEITSAPIPPEAEDGDLPHMDRAYKAQMMTALQLAQEGVRDGSSSNGTSGDGMPTIGIERPRRASLLTGEVSDMNKRRMASNNGSDSNADGSDSNQDDAGQGEGSTRNTFKKKIAGMLRSGGS